MEFPDIEIMPVVDRVVDAALWVGRLFTKQVVHEPLEISDHFLNYPDHTGELPDGNQP